MTRISLAEEYDNRDMVAQMIALKKRQTESEAALTGYVASCAQSASDAEDAKDAAVAAKDTAVFTVSDCVKMTPAAAQTITAYPLTVAQGVTAGGLTTTTLTATGTESHSGTENHSGTVEVSGTFFADSAGANSGNNVRRMPCALSVRDSFDASATDGSTIYYPVVGLDDGNGDGAVRMVMRRSDLSYDIFYQGLGLDEAQSLTALASFDRSTRAWTTTAVTPGAGAGSTEIATVGYVSDTGGSLNNILHTLGNENRTGTLNMQGVSSVAPLRIKGSALDITSATAQDGPKLRFSDMNDNMIFQFYVHLTDTGVPSIRYDYRKSDGTIVYGTTLVTGA